MTHRAVHTVYGALERNWNVPQERVYTASGSSIFRATCVTCAEKPHTYTGDTTPSMMLLLLITLMCRWPMCGPDGTKHRVIIITSSCVCVYVRVCVCGPLCRRALRAHGPCVCVCGIACMRFQVLLSFARARFVKDAPLAKKDRAAVLRAEQGH